MSFDWRPESKDRYFRKAEAAVKAAGFDDILRVDRDQFSVVKGTVKVHFKPISRDGKTRRWWEAKRTIENMHEVPPAKDQFGRKHKSIFIHAYMILEMEEQDTQKEFLADMAAAGHFVATCYSAEEAIKVIEEYLNLSDAVHMERNLKMSIPNNSILKDGKIKN